MEHSKLKREYFLLRLYTLSRTHATIFLCVMATDCCYLVCICCTMFALLFFTLDSGLLARSQYSEGPATGHLDTGFSWFPCA